MQAYNPYDAEYGDDPAPNGTMPLFRNGTLTSEPPGVVGVDEMVRESQPLDIYDASVAGVMLVGAVFACGLVLALMYVVWQTCVAIAEATVDVLLWCSDCAKRRCECCLRRRAKQRVNGMDLPIEDEDEDGDDPAHDPRRTQTYVVGE